jgi:hypothetical protein
MWDCLYAQRIVYIANMLKSLKDIKRRGIQGILETMGATDRTIDEQYEEYKERYVSGSCT